MDLRGLLKFTELVHELLRVERMPFATGTDRRENDVEHSYQLAITAWYLNNRHQLGMDTKKLMQYALAHDLVEVHAGDTDFYTSDEELLKSKPEREAAAQAKLKETYPDFPELHEAIEGYQTKAGREGKFVYALDKILTILNIYLDNGKSWKHRSIKLDELIKRKEDKVKFSPEIEEYFNELVKLLREREAELFGAN